MSELSKDEQIKLLTEQLLRLIATQESQQVVKKEPIKLWNSSSTELEDDFFNTKKLSDYKIPTGRGDMGQPKSIAETLMDFERLGIDINHVRLIMEATDKKYGNHSNFSSKESLFEELQKLMK